MFEFGERGESHWLYPFFGGEQDDGIKISGAFSRSKESKVKIQNTPHSPLPTPCLSPLAR
jgi:hypothetical protein